MSSDVWVIMKPGYIFFPLLFFIFFFSFLLIYGGSGVGVLGSWIWFLELVFSFDGDFRLWCGVFWVVLGFGLLYINMEE